MADLYIEEGIGENRRIRVENGEVTLAWADWNETLIVGSRVRAKVMPRSAGASRGLVMTDQGEPILVRGIERHHTEGSEVTVQILRAAIGEAGRQKPAQGYVTKEPERRWTHAERVRAGGHDLKAVRQFPVDGWEEIVDLALSRKAEFPGGSIVLSPTPAMTLIDVDGYGPPLQLCLAAIPAIARAIDLLDIKGSIGIDFPTLQTKEDRRKVDQALEEALSGFPGERTAMNGFGFVQLVSRVDGPSILHRYTFSRTAACARIALRRGELAQETGRVLLLTVHPALKAKLKPEWLEELARRTGKEVRIETDPALALEAPQAQVVNP